jgi:hypothetical protein
MHRPVRRLHPLICLSLWPGIVALADQAPIVKTFNKLPLAFEKNQGSSAAGAWISWPAPRGYSVFAFPGAMRASHCGGKRRPHRPAWIFASWALARLPFRQAESLFQARSITLSGAIQRAGTRISPRSNASNTAVCTGASIWLITATRGPGVRFHRGARRESGRYSLAVEGASKISIDGSGRLGHRDRRRVSGVPKARNIPGDRWRHKAPSREPLRLAGLESDLLQARKL